MGKPPADTARHMQRPHPDRPQISQPEPPRPRRRASEARHSVRHTARHFFKSKAQIRHILTVSHPLQNRKAHDLYRVFNGQSWFFFGALEGTRIPGPLIKRIQGASFVKYQKCEEALILSHHRKIRICTHRIVCTQCNALQPLSSYSGVQKVCKNVQMGKTKPNGQINQRFYGRV